MSVTIGRCSIPSNVVQFTQQGNQITIQIHVKPTTALDLNHMKALRQQLTGLLDNEDEPVVPFTNSLDSSWDGFYKVTGGSVPTGPTTAVDGILYDCSLQMERVMSFANAACEVTTQSVVRTNAHSFTVPPSVICALVLGTPSEYITSALPSITQIGRPAASGATVFARTTAAPVAQTWYQMVTPPASFYNGACTVEYSTDGTTWYIATGKQIPARSIWRISNELVRLTSANAAASGKLEIWDGTGWDSINVSHVTNGAVGPGIGLGNGTAQPNLTIRRNTPDTVVVKVAIAEIRFEYTIRRGNHLIEVSWVATTATKYGAGFTATVATTAVSTWGVRATSNDAGGNRCVFGMPVAITADNVNGRINAATATTTGQMFLGVELAGSSAISGNAAADLANQYFGGSSWSQRVVQR